MALQLYTGDLPKLYNIAMTMSLAELHYELANAKEIRLLTSEVSGELHNRSVAAIHARAMFPGTAVVQGYDELMDAVRQRVDTTDLSTKDSIADGDEFFGMRIALFSATTNDSVHPERFALMLTIFLLGEQQPGIDEYVDTLHDTTLMDKLSLAYDKEYLVKIEKDMEIRDRAVIVGDTMLYPHQFVRRFYSASFVNLPPLLRRCLDQGLSVKLRLDPLRSSKPDYYRDWIEADYWHGRHFSAELLGDKDKRSLWTLHGTTDFMPSDEKPLSPGYPVSFTGFRSKMMDADLREFMVEEFTPTVNPLLPSWRIEGVGKKYTLQKFAHLVYDQKCRVFNHLDGAVRVFRNDEYAETFSKLPNDPGEKIGVRHKLFLVEGNIGMDMVQDLLYEFFMYNPHIEEYFAPLATAVTLA